MSFPPAESMPASGDYDRLGVRASEARPRVIRHAVQQLAEPLARRHLETPDGQLELDLAQVVTSGYRLLDPRRRENAIERALLTQQEPVRTVPARWAHPKALLSGKGIAAGTSRSGDFHFESIPADSSTLFPNPRVPVAEPAWLEQWLGRGKVWVRPSRLWLRGIGRSLRGAWRSPWYVGGLLTGLILLSLAIRPLVSGRSVDARRHDPSTPAALSSETPSVARPPKSDRPSTAAGDQVASDADRAAGLRRETDPEANRSRPDDAAGSEGESAAPPARSKEDVAAVIKSIADKTLAGQYAKETSPDPSLRSDHQLAVRTAAATVPSADGSASEPPTEAASPAIDQAVAIGDNETAPPKPAGDTVAGREEPASTPSQAAASDEGEPKAATADSDEGSTTTDQVAESTDAEDAPAQAVAPPRQAPLPSPEELKESQLRLQRLVADRPEPVTERQQMRQVEWLLDLRRDSAPGSADALAIAQLAVAKLVTAGHYQQAAAIIDELEGQFDVADSQLGCSTTEQLVDSAISLADQRRIVAWCLVLSEKYLRRELFDGASEMTRLGTVSAVKLGDADLRGRLSQRRDAISTARRSAESVWAITKRSGPENASATDAAQAGRYLCLVIRDWKQGVPWLAKSSDPRLAAAAQRELQLASLSQADRAAADAEEIDGGIVAKEWLDACDRFRGRLGESALLHAYELVSQAVEESVGLRTLELKKQLDSLREQLPEDLISSPATSTPRIQQAAAAGAAANNAAGNSVMEGRLTLNGRDTGTLIRYAPGVQLRQNVVDQIFQALQQPAAPWLLAFEGVLRLDQPATVRFIAAGPAAPEGDMSLRVNGTPQSLSPSVRGQSAAIDLTAGMHRVTWQISGLKLDEAFLLVQDEVTGDRLDLMPPPAGLNALPSRLRINIQRAP